MVEVKDFQPAREMPETLVRVPGLITDGAFAEAVLRKYQELAGSNANFRFNGRGSNVFITGLVNKVLEDSGFRVAVPTDRAYEEIFPLIKDKFYTDFNALDVRAKKPVRKENVEIWNRVIELAEQSLGRSPQFPFRVQGFYCVPDETKKGYEAGIEPAKNFRVIEDERLSLPTETKFKELDENGMIVPSNKGFTLYALDNSVSRVCLSGGGYLGSDYVNLADSYDTGRVAFVDAEGVASKFSVDKYSKQVLEAFKAKVKKAESVRDGALSALEKI